MACMVYVRTMSRDPASPECILDLEAPVERWMTLLDRALEWVLHFQHVNDVQEHVALVANGLMNQDRPDRAPAA